MTRDQVAQLLRDEFRDMTKALSGVYNAMASDERHRKVAVAGTVKLRSEALSALNPRSEMDTFRIATKTVEFVALMQITGGDITTTAWRKVIDHVLKCEQTIAESASLPFGEPYGSIAEAFWDPFLATLSHLSGKPSPLLGESTRFVLDMSQDLGAMFLLAILRSHRWGWDGKPTAHNVPLAVGPWAPLRRLSSAVGDLER